MTISMNLWSIKEGSLKEIQKSRVDLEAQLEDWVHENPMLLNLDVMIIGRQVHTAYGGYIDLLAIDREGNLVIIELKRDKTPRDIVAQCLDYASWVCDLGYNDIEEIFANYTNKRLSEEFKLFYGEEIPDPPNANHKMVIVAASLDNSTERIISYLTENHGININAIFFNVFEFGDKKIIGRSFFRDPEQVEAKSNQGKRAPWTGYYYVNTGIEPTNPEHPRKWNLNTEYGYISAGGGRRWIKAIRGLHQGSKIFAYIKGCGYAGYGVVMEPAVPVNEFKVGECLLIDKLPEDHPWKTQKVTETEGEWLVRVDWKKTYAQEDVKKIPNGFSSQHVVCRLSCSRTFDDLSKKFEIENDS